MTKNLGQFKSIWKEEYHEGKNLPDDSNKTQQLIIGNGVFVVTQPGLSKFENELSEFTKKLKNDKESEQLLKGVQAYIEELIDRMTTVGIL